MKINTKIVSALLISLVFSGAAFAEGFEHRDGGRDERGGYQEPSRNASSRNEPQRFHRDEAPRGYRYSNNGEGAGPEHRFHRGEKIPVKYRHQNYVVENWHEHNLRKPPRGYHWVQSGADYVLVGVATGLIVDILLSH